MSTTDKIQELFKQGVVSLTVAVSPKGVLYVQAGQVVQTGPNATHMQVQHQADSADLPDLLNQIAKQVDHANGIKTHVLTMPKRN